MKNFLIIFVVLELQCTFLVAESVHWQWRDLVCETQNGKGTDKLSKDPAVCNLYLRETDEKTESSIDSRRAAPVDNALCFDERVNGTLRTYCNLLCPKADTVYLISRNPSVHRSCFVFYTHRLEKRGDDWYLWRDKKCRLSAIEFKIRCEFLFPRASFPKDEEIFRALLKA